MDSLKTETARIRNLSAECRAAGIILEDVPGEVLRVRELVQERNYAAALDLIREIKLDLLARLLLHEPMEVPPVTIENEPVVILPSEALFSAIDERAAENPRHAGRRKPPT